MGELIEFRAVKAQAPQGGGTSGNAEIIIFPGVRIERREALPAPCAAVPRGGRAARNQAVDLKHE